jgi:hypothetical protein
MGFLVRSILSLAPSRRSAVERMQMSEDAARDACRALAATMAPIVGALDAHFKAEGLDFPDKISALPFGF